MCDRQSYFRYGSAFSKFSGLSTGKLEGKDPKEPSERDRERFKHLNAIRVQPWARISRLPDRFCIYGLVRVFETRDLGSGELS